MIKATCRALIDGPETPIIRRSLQALLNYNCLLTFCFHELDVLIKSDGLLMNVCGSQEIPIFNRPPRNRTINELSEEDTYALPRFLNHQLCLLMVHLWILNTVVICSRHRYRFCSEELLIVCLMPLATGDPWMTLIPSNFWGDAIDWNIAFHWFIDHLFIIFYHIISGKSIEGWIGQLHKFKKGIFDHRAKPHYLIELDLYDKLVHPQYIIQCPIDCWRVFEFLDGNNVRTCRPGSSPVSGHAHSLKYCTTLFPNGMVAGVSGTLSNNNDFGVLNLLRLTQYLENILMPGGLLPALFGDSVSLGHN